MGRNHGAPYRPDRPLIGGPRFTGYGYIGSRWGYYDCQKTKSDGDPVGNWRRRPHDGHRLHPRYDFSSRVETGSEGDFFPSGLHVRGTNTSPARHRGPVLCPKKLASSNAAFGRRSCLAESDMARFLPNVEVYDTLETGFETYVQQLTWRRMGAAYSRRSIGAMQGKAMATGFEYRYPYLDRELVEFVLNLPPHCLPGVGRNARIHREAFRPILPAKIADRYAKAEFTPAIANRVRQAIPLIKHVFFTGEWASQKYVTREAALRFFRDAVERYLRGDSFGRLVASVRYPLHLRFGCVCF